MTEQVAASAATGSVDGEQEECRYLLFKLGKELYGTPLLGVREVVEPQEPKPVPNTVGYFLGVINIRGQIVGVIDLRNRFGHKVEKGPENALMVFNTDAGPMAAWVDQVEAVVRLSDDRIDKKPNVKTSVPPEFMLGIAHEGERLVTLVDLNKALGKLELKGSR